jgi:hypothetical protein
MHVGYPDISKAMYNYNWMAVAREWMIERAEKAAEASRGTQRTCVMHGDTFQPLPLTAGAIKGLRLKPLATDTAMARWTECQADPCMALHAVYAAGYGRFLALEEEGAVAFADGLINRVHQHLFAGKEHQGSMEPTGVLVGSLLGCIKESFVAFQEAVGSTGAAAAESPPSTS